MSNAQWHEDQALGERALRERHEPLGVRRQVVELSEADLRRIVGAPEYATVEVVPAADHGPNGVSPARVIIAWANR